MGKSIKFCRRLKILFDKDEEFRKVIKNEKKPHMSAWVGGDLLGR